MKRSLTAISLSAFIFAGCCVPWHGPAIATTPMGTRMCAKHKTALITSRGFRIHTEPNQHVDPDIDKVQRVESCYPNAIPWYESLNSFNGHGDSTTITYCPLCERQAQRITD
jgi:hypothetical protein